MSNQLAALMAMMSPSPFGAPGIFTSGRRTPEGNKLVGGVPDSNHLRGTAADHVGTDKRSLQNYYGPQAKVGWHKNHWHVDGLEDVPYHGKRGTVGAKTEPYYAEKKPMQILDPTKRAQMFNINLPPEQPGFDLRKAIPAMAQLPDFMPGINQAAESNALKGEEKSKKAQTWRAVLGAISDGLLALGNQQPMYAPMAARSAELEEDRNLAREKLQAEIAERRAKAMEPPAFIQNLQAFQNLPSEQKSAYLQYLDMTQPIAVSGPQGTMRVPRQMAGPPPDAVNELRSAVAQGDSSAIAEFEAVFGPGSASSYLGQ